MRSSIILLVSHFPFYPSFFVSSRFFSVLSLFSPISISIVFRQRFVQENVRCDDESIHFCAKYCACLDTVSVIWDPFDPQIDLILIILSTDIFGNKYHSIVFCIVSILHPFYKNRHSSSRTFRTDFRQSCNSVFFKISTFLFSTLLNLIGGLIIVY